MKVMLRELEAARKFLRGFVIFYTDVESRHVAVIDIVWLIYC